MVFARFAEAFILGLLTPLTAVCVLPLYPAFLVYLSSKLKTKDSKWMPLLFGLLITLGVITFMLALGLIFTTIFQISLTKVIGIVSPIAFGILALISLVLIFDLDIGRIIPSAKMPQFKNPLTGSFLYGFFFGAIVIPCNPAFIAVLLARTASVTDFTMSIITFLFFGFGIGLPLIVLAAVSSEKTGKIIGFFIKYKKIINRLAGIIMIGIALYYLFYVFRILG